MQYQLDDVSVPVRTFTQLYVICCFDAHISRPVIDDHEMEKSFQTGDLFLELFNLVSWIASIKVTVLKLYVMKIVHGA